MMRRALVLAAGFAASLVAIGPARGQDDLRTASKFVDGLRERGYYDLAEEFLERLRANPETPEDLRLKIDFEQAKLMSDEAATSADLVLQKELLDKARSKLIAFTKDHPTHPQAAEALVKLGALLVERGFLAMIRAEDPDEKDKPRFLSEARTSYREAREAYVQADQKLTAAFNSYPPYIPENKTELIEERRHASNEMMNAQLQKATVDYQEGQTFPAGSKERNESLTNGLKQFEDIYNRYRSMHAGLTARMWQAKCYEEKGEYGAAMGLYNELMRHDAPELRSLQRHVGYFQILLYNKRKEYALAELGAQGWLKTYGGAAELRSSLGLSIGVRLEMAKAILAQIPEASTAGEKADRKGRAVELLSQIVRYTSRQKAEALKLLKENKPSAAARFEDVARLNFDEATAQAEEAMASQEWPKAILLLKQAIRRADPAKDADKVLLPRHRLALCYYNNHQPYEALVISEHIARRYPYKPLGPKAAELGIGSLAEAYNTFVEIDRVSDLNRLIELAKYTIATWPDKEEADYARMTLGQIAHGLGKYTEAIEAYESVRPKSPRRVAAETAAGASHWEQSRTSLRAGKAAEADEEVKKALATLNTALTARREAGTPSTDADLVNNVCDIANIHLETGKPAEAIALLDPLAKAQAASPGPSYPRLMATLLKAHIGAGQVDLAQADMAALEKAGGGNNLTQLYYNLGKLLEKEMDTLKAKGDGAGLARTRTSYQKFLAALADAKAGQTYDSLQWAGESMLKLQNPKEAGAVFKRILETADKDPAFLGQEGKDLRRQRTRLSLSAALRGQRDFTAAEAMVAGLLKDYPKTIEPLIEKGLLLEDQAAVDPSKWKASIAYWQSLAPRLGKARTKPPEYYDAWYHVAYALSKDGQKAKAKQILGGVMRLSPNVGGAEIKKKYTSLLASLK